MGTPSITVRSLQRKIPVNVDGLEKFARDALKRCLQSQRRKRTDLREVNVISVWLISDWRISRLHLQFFGENSATDVITFHDGEIFISVETARRNACEFGNSLMSEIKLCIIHGLLHLHGFDDRQTADSRRMKKTQEKILRGMAVQIGTVSQL
jgi:probable rRNA maturation factor